jgi:hypothetical protein
MRKFLIKTILLLFSTASFLGFSTANLLQRNSEKSNPSYKSSSTLISDREYLLGDIQVTNNIKLELVSVELQAGLLRATICHAMPTPADWLLGAGPQDVVLDTGKTQVQVQELGLLYWNNAPDGTVSERCDYVNFPVAQDEKPSSFTITIASLVTSMPEVPDCTKTQEKLNASRSGIVITCQASDHGFSWEVAQKPAALSMGEARRISMEAFVDRFDGPWVFTVNLK